MAGEVAPAPLRVCRDCGVTQPLEAFPFTVGKRQREKGYRMHRCFDCRRKAQAVAKAAWCKANTDRDRAYMKAFRDSGKMAESWRRYYVTHRAEQITKTRAYYTSLVGSFTEAEWRKLAQRFGGKCAYCKSAVTEHRDHVVPVSRGGTNRIGNILPACAKCNLSKGPLTLMEWRLSGRAPAAMRPINYRRVAA